MIAGSLARRYARALLDVAAEGEAAEGILGELRQVVELLREHRELRLVLTNPSILRRDALQILEAVLDRMEVRPLTRTFLRVVLEAGRAGALEEILRAYEELVDERLGRVRAAVTVAAPLEDAQAGRLAEELRRLTGKEVRLEIRQDPTLLGGMVTRIGSRVYDGSLAGRLTRLRGELARGD